MSVPQPAVLTARDLEPILAVATKLAAPFDLTTMPDCYAEPRFDADTKMPDLINSGRLSDSPIGRYLHTLKNKFQGPVVADILCMVRLHTELALRAKGILIMRENGFNAPVDEATRAKFAELRYLEDSIGRTGLLAIQPMLHMSHRDLWQLYMLGS